MRHPGQLVLALPDPLKPTRGKSLIFVMATGDGVCMEDGQLHPHSHGEKPSTTESDLVQALTLRAWEIGAFDNTPGWQPFSPDPTIADPWDHFAAKVLVVPRSKRWQEATSTALLGGWCEPLLRTGHLPCTALGALKAEARTVHRQLVPVWRRRTRHGRVLSLDADLGGLSLYDLVAADVDYLAHTAGGVFEDERLNAVLRALTEEERRVVFAYAEDEGTTWTEAAAAAGAPDPQAFGERVRRKARRQADEQRRRAAQRPTGSMPPR
ncbi:hypothetical protein [Streptomyces sp. NPDC051636]|uniref:hypothetical protein n=1 Tax=Streptomyces sp. NPDC051636 TaxID=3365663 RepID=UPI0037B7E3CC